MNYYTPKIEDIKLGFRYEELTINEGFMCRFGDSNFIQKHKFEEWVKREITNPLLLDNFKINTNKFIKLIYSKKIRTCKEFGYTEYITNKDGSVNINFNATY